MNTIAYQSYRERLILNQKLIKQAGSRCQGAPQHPDCRAKDGQAHPETDKRVTLRVVNERVMCERCILSYDFSPYRTQDWRTRRKALGNAELFPIEERIEMPKPRGEE